MQVAENKKSKKPILAVFAVLLIILLSVATLKQASATTLFADGFESGDFSEWTENGTLATVQSIVTHSGTYAIGMQDATEGYQGYVGKTIVVGGDTVYFKVWANLSAPVDWGINNFLVVYDDASNRICSLAIYKQTNYYLRIYNTVNSTSYDSEAISFTPLTWESYTIKVTLLGDGNGELTAYKNDSKINENTGLSIATGDSLGIFWAGTIDSTQDTTNYIDDVEISNTYPDGSPVPTPTPTPSPTPEPTLEPIPEGTPYFNCTFSDNTTYYENFEPFLLEEPSGYIPEKGLWNWVNCRPEPPYPEGFWTVAGPYAGSIYMIPDPVDTSRACVKFILDSPETRPFPTDQHTKLYELQSENMVNYGSTYVTAKEAYYNFKVYVPSTLDVQDRILIWQLCGDLASYGDPESGFTGPQISLSFISYGYPTAQSLSLIIHEDYYNDSTTRYFYPCTTSAFPKDQWVDITIYVKQGSDFQAEDGIVTVWLNTVQVVHSETVPTASYSGTPYFIWGIGCYGSNAELLNQTVYFKDVSVTMDYPLDISLNKVHSIFGIEVYNGTKIFGVTQR